MLKKNPQTPFINKLNFKKKKKKILSRQGAVFLALSLLVPEVYELELQIQKLIALDQEN
jgi:hypothetical protein